MRALRAVLVVSGCLCGCASSPGSGGQPSAADAGGSDVAGQDVVEIDTGAEASAGVEGGSVDGGGRTDAGGDAQKAVDGGCDAAASYDELVLCDHPVAYWAMHAASSTEPDLTANANTGSYVGGAPGSATMPNGDTAADFNGSSQYLTIPSNASLSIPTTGDLTWEGWIRPDVLQFPNVSDGYVDWMGKCASYSPTCEWEARMYDTTNSQGRCNRMSAYVFNPSAGLGSAADWQPTCGLIQAGTWYHVVGEYTVHSQPADCASAPMYPGSIDVWVDGVPWDQSQHNPTGCMSQYNVIPTANDSPINIGTMALDTWFPGGIGKVAVYGYLLTQAQISAHYVEMTGSQPAGSCGNTCTL
jgi:hypothetical protein